MNIYIGNLSYRATEEDLQSIFGEYGEVTRASIARDAFTGRSKGFGFVEMSSDEEAQSAIEALNGTEMQGRQVLVQQARPRGEGGGGGGRQRPVQGRRPEH